MLTFGMLQVNRIKIGRSVVHKLFSILRVKLEKNQTANLLFYAVDSKKFSGM